MPLTLHFRYYLALFHLHNENSHQIILRLIFFRDLLFSRDFAKNSAPSWPSSLYPFFKLSLCKYLNQ